MILLRIRARKRNGLVAQGYWYVVSELPNGDFTISMNKVRALQFSTEEAADAFNKRQLQLGHISAPFELIHYESK